ncbi:hypothetical protein ACFSJQ_08040 [Vibrio olivae]|uniref:Uncharacterized protein n=1 Tax=Vibrio olivae TaxID=1243002 RepID=A0ABV5HI34_9VIBR
MKSLLVDRMGQFSEMAYHEYLYLITGKSSCLAMTDDELKNTVYDLKNEGYLEDLKPQITHLPVFSVAE